MHRLIGVEFYHKNVGNIKDGNSRILIVYYYHMTDMKSYSPTMTWFLYLCKIWNDFYVHQIVFFCSIVRKFEFESSFNIWKSSIIRINQN